ncbi:DgyrCDS3247 [Dimorphilus gyrociliatus]|uniref:DgyrCDS3247 n=1 Tax=Dimorphilus gyrociliatus TaxID=2664684 RepID=A0A7I8VEF2_9ANNE|nr:DgyrCDS3247 [Dimorphilus gyrociliatus]
MMIFVYIIQILYYCSVVCWRRSYASVVSFYPNSLFWAVPEDDTYEGGGQTSIFKDVNYQVQERGFLIQWTYLRKNSDVCFLDFWLFTPSNKFELITKSKLPPGPFDTVTHYTLDYPLQVDQDLYMGIRPGPSDDKCIAKLESDSSYTSNFNFPNRYTSSGTASQVGDTITASSTGSRVYFFQSTVLKGSLVPIIYLKTSTTDYAFASKLKLSFSLSESHSTLMLETKVFSVINAVVLISNSEPLQEIFVHISTRPDDKQSKNLCKMSIPTSNSNKQIIVEFTCSEKNSGKFIFLESIMTFQSTDLYIIGEAIAETEFKWTPIPPQKIQNDYQIRVASIKRCIDECEQAANCNSAAVGEASCILNIENSLIDFHTKHTNVLILYKTYFKFENIC